MFHINRDFSLFVLILLLCFPLYAQSLESNNMPEKPINLNANLSHPILDVMPALNELSLKYPSAISLGSGRPSDQFCQPEKVLSFLDEYEKYAKQYKQKIPYNRLIGQYGPSAGIVNEIVANHLRTDESIHVEPEDIVMTVGFQEAIELVVKTLFNKNDVIIIPDPIFVGVTGSAILNNTNIYPIKWKGDNFDKNQFEKIIADVKKQGLNPKAIYVIPDFSNPYSTNLPYEDRIALLNWAQQNSVLVIEDNPYGVFRYEDKKIPTLKSLDKFKNVIYLGTAAKTVYPGLRIGYVVADQICQLSNGKKTTLAKELAKAKSFNTVNTPPLEQALFASVLLRNKYSLVEFNQPQVVFNKENLRRMQLALNKHFPKDKYPNIKWNNPKGGYFLVINLPFEFGIKELEESAREHNVIVIPLSMFSYIGGPSNEVRLSFTNMNPEIIEEGIARFAKYVKFKLGNAR